jgi:hypothetical protein
MIRIIRRIRFASFLAILVFLSSPLLAQETRTVTAEGVSVVQGDNVDIARDAAIQDAQTRAVEQAIGTLIDSQTQVENYQVISDKILSQTKGYITHYSIVRENREDNLLRVTITAEVSLGQLSNDLSGIGILMGQMHKPRTIILVAEQNVGQEWYAWWWWGPGAVHAAQSDMSIIDNTLMDKFAEKGFEMIDQAVAARELKVTPAYKVQDLSVQQAKTIGSQVDAEVVIVGKGIAKLYGEVGGGLKSVQADISLRAVRTDTGQVLAAVTTHAAAVHISEITAGNDALRKAASDAADQLMGKILAQYQKETGGTRSVNITVSGLSSKTQFVKFKDVLRNQVRGITDLHERSFANGVAKISVDSKNSAQALSDEVSLKDFGAFSVEVVSSTANSLELRVVPK